MPSTPRPLLRHRAHLPLGLSPRLRHAVRLLGDFAAAEEAVHEAYAAAMVQWPEEGIPANPVVHLCRLTTGDLQKALRVPVKRLLESFLPLPFTSAASTTASA